MLRGSQAQQLTGKRKGKAREDEGTTRVSGVKRLPNKKILSLLLYAGFVRVLENLESPGLLLWHFPGLESPGKRPLVLHGKFWKSVKLN